MAQATKKAPLVPKLRFKEFVEDGEWEEKKLDDICSRILQKVNDTPLVTVSITAGKGFVSQESKFGRNIAGEQYKNYIYLKYGDFAYNKGNSKKYPQGYVCQLKEFGQAAASSAFLCFRLLDKHEASFFQGLFDENIHGKQLARHITSGARSDGLLNIKPDIFFNILLPIPPLHSEQQKIADCLSSLDKNITAESQKLEALTAHKKALMQKLFPGEGANVPALRFKEFAEDGEWEEKRLGDIGDIATGTTPSTSVLENYGAERQFVSPSDICDLRFIEDTKTKLTQIGFKKGRAIPAYSILFVCIGSTIGKLAQNMEECLTNQQINAIIPNCAYSSSFMYFLLSFYSKDIAELAGKHAIPIINKTVFSNYIALLPHKSEQQRIADCLASLDEYITAQGRKIELLKEHKKSLMQQLFPCMEEENV